MLQGDYPARGCQFGSKRINVGFRHKYALSGVVIRRHQGIWLAPWVGRRYSVRQVMVPPRLR